jgi:predicted phage tail protein
MTKINLYGLLAFEFGDSIEVSLRKPKEVFDAIGANRKNFHKRIIELSEQGLNYAIIVDGFDIKNLEELQVRKSPKVIDLVTVICGKGPIAAVAGLGLAIGGGMAISAGAVGGALFAAQMALSIGIGLMGMAIQQMLAPKPESQKPPSSSIGTAAALSQSFYFANRANSAEQGSPVPIGYGRLKIGSLVIQATTSSYSYKQSSDGSKIKGDAFSPYRGEATIANIESRL